MYRVYVQGARRNRDSVVAVVDVVDVGLLLLLLLLLLVFEY